MENKAVRINEVGCFADDCGKVHLSIDDIIRKSYVSQVADAEQVLEYFNSHLKKIDRDTIPYLPWYVSDETLCYLLMSCSDDFDKDFYREIVSHIIPVIYNLQGTLFTSSFNHVIDSGMHFFFNPEFGSLRVIGVNQEPMFVADDIVKIFNLIYSTNYNLLKYDIFTNLSDVEYLFYVKGFSMILINQMQVLKLMKQLDFSYIKLHTLHNWIFKEVAPLVVFSSNIDFKKGIQSRFLPRLINQCI